MRCPSCGSSKDRVIDSRAGRDGNSIRRRRECLACRNRYTTYEYIESPLLIVKKDGRREAFDRQKILNGIRKACEKRPISTEQMENLVDVIENEIQSSGQTEVKSELVGEKVMKSLQELDGVAYVRFASVYRSFREVSDFAEAAKSYNEKRHRRT